MSEAKHTPEPGDWYCKNCGYLSGTRVTNVETCDTCHEPVVWHEAGVTQEHIDRCVNALRGLDVGKVEALLDAVRAESESKYDDKISVAEHTRRQHVRMNACDELRDSIRAGGGQ